MGFNQVGNFVRGVNQDARDAANEAGDAKVLGTALERIDADQFTAIYQKPTPEQFAMSKNAFHDWRAQQLDSLPWAQMRTMREALASAVSNYRGESPARPLSSVHAMALRRTCRILLGLGDDTAPATLEKAQKAHRAVREALHEVRFRSAVQDLEARFNEAMQRTHGGGKHAGLPAANRYRELVDFHCTIGQIITDFPYLRRVLFEADIPVRSAILAPFWGLVDALGRGPASLQVPLAIEASARSQAALQAPSPRSSPRAREAEPVDLTPPPPPEQPVVDGGHFASWWSPIEPGN